LAQVNAYESLFQSLTQKPLVAWKWYADDYHKEKKQCYTPQEKPALKTIKKMV
jgi:hypothetical protein